MLWSIIMKRFLSTLAVFALSAGFVFAQDNASESVQCTTVVIKSLSIEKDKDLDFGTVAQGVGEVEIEVGDDAAVKLTITGQEYYDVLVSYSSPDYLETSDGDQLSFEEKVKHNASSEAAGASNIDSGDSVQLNSNGNHYLFLGGTIDVAANQATGFYTGTVSFSVEYDL